MPNVFITNKCLIDTSMIIMKKTWSIISETLHRKVKNPIPDTMTINGQEYGFKKNSSTELAALELLDRVLDQLDKYKIPINFYIDLSKAFDSLRHDILLDNLT